MQRRKARKGLILTIRLFALAGALLLLLPVQAAAADVRGNNQVTIGPGQTVTDDLYAFGGTVAVQGTVDGNLIAGGGTVTISGRVARDVMVAGGTVDISGPVDGSVRVLGGTVTLSAPVAGDVLVGGGTLNLGSEATVGRDLLLGAGTATIAAPVKRNVTLGSGTVTLENTVGGNVTGTVDQLTLASGASVSGNLDYTSNHTVVMANGATVAGPVTRHTPASTTTPVFGSPAAPALSFLGWLRGLIGISALGLLLVLLFPAFSAKAVEALEHRPGASVGFGAAILMITPIVGVIAFIVGLIIGGWWLGLLLLPAYILALAVGYVVTGLLIGRWTANRFGWKLHLAWMLLGGLFVLTVVGLIPILGAIVSILAVIFGLGALTIAATTRPPVGQVVARAAA
jgi:cytoskeletal protein CcmA (bactofilin family)